MLCKSGNLSRNNLTSVKWTTSLWRKFLITTQTDRWTIFDNSFFTLALLSLERFAHLHTSSIGHETFRQVWRKNHKTLPTILDYWVSNLNFFSSSIASFAPSLLRLRHSLRSFKYLVIGIHIVTYLQPNLSS